MSQSQYFPAQEASERAAHSVQSDVAALRPALDLRSEPIRQLATCNHAHTRVSLPQIQRACSRTVCARLPNVIPDAKEPTLVIPKSMDDAVSVRSARL